METPAVCFLAVQPGRLLPIPVLWFSRVLLHVQQLIDDLWALHPLSDQEEDGHHAAHLVVEECLSRHLELAQPERVLQATFSSPIHPRYLGAENCSLEVDDAIGHVHFAEVPEVVRPHVALGCSLHEGHVQAGAGEEVAVGPLETAEPGAEVWLHGGPGQHTDVRWEHPVQDVGVAQLFLGFTASSLRVTRAAI